MIQQQNVVVLLSRSKVLCRLVLSKYCQTFHDTRMKSFGVCTRQYKIPDLKKKHKNIYCHISNVIYSLKTAGFPTFTDGFNNVIHQAKTLSQRSNVSV